MESVFLIFACALFFSTVSLLGVVYFVQITDFGRLYRLAHDNSIRLLRITLHHPWVAKITDLESCQGSGIGFNAIMAIQGGVVAGAFVLGGILLNPWIVLPLFLMGREIFIMIAAFLRKKRKIKENEGFETLLRRYQVLYNHSKSGRDCLVELEKSLQGIWRDEVGKLYRRLILGGDTKAAYEQFAAAFPGNPHVHLFSKILYQADVYGGEIQDAAAQVLQDVMQERLNDEQNQSETGASMVVSIILNFGVIAIAIHNLLDKTLAEVLVGSPDGRLILATAALFCAASIRLTRTITDS
jgi:Flp pilus assembly protein TadB